MDLEEYEHIRLERYLSNQSSLPSKKLASSLSKAQKKEQKRAKKTVDQPPTTQIPRKADLIQDRHLMVKMPLRWRHSQESFSLLRAEQAIVGYPYELTTTIKFDLGTLPSLKFGGIYKGGKRQSSELWTMTAENLKAYLVI